MKHKKIIIAAAVLVGGGLAFAAYRRRKNAAESQHEGRIVAESVDCISGGCDGPTATESWLSKFHPSNFLDWGNFSLGGGSSDSSSSSGGGLFDFSGFTLPGFETAGSHSGFLK